MLIKLAQFLTGTSAVTADLCRFMADRLNDGFAPLRPFARARHGGRDHPALPSRADFCRRGLRSRRRTASACRPPSGFAHRGIAPYEPKSKEGLSLINGVALAPALAFDLGAAPAATRCRSRRSRPRRSIEGLGASLEAYSDDVWQAAPRSGHDGDRATLCAGCSPARRSRATPRQPPVSFRVVPQVHGACLAAIRAPRSRRSSRSGTSIGDNPAFIADETSPTFGRLVHSGNFHCAELTAAVEAAALATAQVALLSERRLHRLLDERFSGLAPQLARAARASMPASSSCTRRRSG